MKPPTEYHYTYYSYEEWGRGYFGSRTCRCLPKEDVKYFGSFSDETFKPTQKIILKEDYATRKDAYADEIILQQYYKVVENSHFANRAYQTSIGFSTYGAIPTPKTIDKKSKKLKGKNNPFYGKTHSEETKRKQSNIKKGKNNPNYGKKWWNDGNGNTKFTKECPGENWILGIVKHKEDTFQTGTKDFH